MTRKQATAIRLSRTDKMPVRAKHDLLEHFAGRGKGAEVHNVEGCKLEIEAVLYRHPPSRFSLCVNIGGDWFEVLTVQPDDPGIDMLRKADRMETHGPSKTEMEKQQRRERETLEQQHSEHVYRETRAEARAEIKKAERLRQAAS